jgi:gamma-glutamyltranspeptidase / glutathione hydrolase
MENKGFATVLGILVAIGLIGVWVYEQPEDLRNDPGRLSEDFFRDVTGRERQAGYERDREAAEVLDTLDGYGVSAGHPLAVDAGMEVLAAGGNAVDAAIATAYALGVVEPYGSGIGGGGAVIVHPSGGEPTSYDYREVVADDGVIGSLNTGTPGFVRGMEVLHADHGSADLADLIAPAIAFAEEGIEVSSTLERRLAAAAFRMPVAELPTFFPHGRAIPAGELLVQEELAETLRVIADEGADAFYEGPIAQALAEAVDGVDTESLAGYEVQRLEPVHGTFGDYDIVSAPPPLPGVALIQTLQIAEELGVADYEPGSADYYHAIAMAWLFANHFRIDEVGDTDFVDVPVDWLTDRDSNRSRAGQIQMDAVLEVDEDEPYGGLETDTTHLTVVDRDGTMVSMTNTLSNFFGSGQQVNGFFLNDQLKNFASDEDSPNAAEAGKRPRSFITPTIVAQDDRPVLGLGSSGGRRIPIVLAQVLVRWGLQGEELADAAAGERFHREQLTLEVEQELPSDVAESLFERGYTAIEPAPTSQYFGSVQALALDYEADRLLGVADERRGGDWRVDAP